MTAEQLLALVGQGFAALVALLTLIGGGYYVGRRINRTDSVQSAAASVEIAEAAGEERVHAGQTAELARLQKLVEHMSGELRSVGRRVWELEASVSVLKMYFKAITLCDDCRRQNKGLIDRVDDIFHQAATGATTGES